MARKILLAVDGSAPSTYMLDWAAANFLRADDHVLLVHVHERPSEMYMLDTSLASVYEETEKYLKQNGTLLLEKTKEIITKKGFTVVETFLRGDGKEDIVNVADEEKVDTVVIGSRGLGMIKRSFLGSTSDFVTHHCRCPVIVVKS